MAGERKPPKTSNKKLSAFPYPGGKTVHFEKIVRRFPDHRRYVEPFGGSVAVLLNKSPSHIEVYNDLDGDVVQFFEVVRDRRDDLLDWLQYVPYSRDVYETWVREFFAGERPDDPVERAGRWFFLRYAQFNASLDRRSGFKTGGRRNEARSYRWSIHRLDDIAERFREVTLEHESYEDVVDRYDHPDTLFYLDPPYFEADREYYRVDDDFDHQALADVLDGTEGDWVVSYDDVPPALREIATTVETYPARYSMSHSDDRPEHTECLVMNYDPADRRGFAPAGQTTLGAVGDDGR